MFDRISRAFHNWRVTVETTEELSRLSDGQLRDIGLTREQIPEVVRGRNIA
ncbi:DUF1127 domain-containing protein [Acuticoccus sp. MNP-M23]|uniref:DUF1127 domain-containing protein n=1 Tax=Acuticoccus sp. MNP-M23 TaxID=3072793 RepID=UPI0028164C7F|nr:DUF1127 domain-containing protein [Acuticoccus sp. MNP-M23]WMS40992.1 DUF1127 domain-containing protein [Acuticoccus sp. MNP-M23]